MTKMVRKRSLTKQKFIDLGTLFGIWDLDKAQGDMTNSLLGDS
jgi:hypothetical protein